MEISIFNLLCSLLFVYLVKEKMFIRVKRGTKTMAFLLFLSLVLYTSPAFAADASLFGDLTAKGIQIFEGMRDIIYVVAGFGIIGVAIGGFFGNINWKWLGAIVIGLMVIGLTGGILSYIGGSDAPAISDTLK